MLNTLPPGSHILLVIPYKTQAFLITAEHLMHILLQHSIMIAQYISECNRTLPSYLL